MNIKIFDTLPEEASAIRRSVFMDEQGFEEEFDETDAIATHLVMYDRHTPVATCRLFPREGSDTYIVGRLAVRKEYRGRGLGAALLEAAEEEAAKRHGDSVILHAQLQAQRFYEKQGYSACGEIGDEEGCPHTWMRKKI